MPKFIPPLVVALIATAVPALAQNTPGIYLITVADDGEQTAHHIYGWGGISEDAVSIRGGSLKRADLSAVCRVDDSRRTECPDLVHQVGTEDIVVWADGSSSEGLAEVVCPSLDSCFVVQGGDERPWHEVSFIAFGQPGKTKKM